MTYPSYRIEKIDSEVAENSQAPLELSPSELHELCECAREVARSARDVVMDIYESSADFGVLQKSDATPVTKADLAADERIRRLLKKHTSFPILSEEKVLDWVDRKDRKSLWIVDPIDGTQNFINKDGQFSVLIGLLHLGRPVIGVIDAPPQAVQFSAWRGGGAYRQDGRAAPQAISHPLMKRPLRAVFSSGPSEAGRALEVAFCRDNGLQDEQVFRVGSAYKLARIAEGEFDLAVRFDVLSEWDVAAADCVLSEAGCRTKDVLENRPISYNSRASLALPGYLVLRSDYDFVQSK